MGGGGLSREREREREKLQALRQECVRPKSLSMFDLKQQCADRSLYDIKAHESYREQTALHAFEIRITLTVL